MANEIIAKTLGVPIGKKLTVVQRSEAPLSGEEIPAYVENIRLARDVSANVRRGRNILFALFAGIILIRLCILAILAGIGERLAPMDYIRSLVLILMLLGVYSGISKLKNIFIVLCLLALILTALKFITDSSLVNGVEFAATAVLGGVPACVLLFSRTVSAFLEHQAQTAH